MIDNGNPMVLLAWVSHSSNDQLDSAMEMIEDRPIFCFAEMISSVSWQEKWCEAIPPPAPTPPPPAIEVDRMYSQLVNYIVKWEYTHSKDNPDSDSEMGSFLR